MGFNLIWIIKLFSKNGREQKGIRPGIIISDTKTDLILLIPLTSNLGALKKFPFTIQIKKSEINRLEKNSVAPIFQLLALDKKRLKSKIGRLSDEETHKIDTILKKMLGL